MRPVESESAETQEPEEKWRRISLAGSDGFSFEWSVRPPNHSSPMDSRDNEQPCIAFEGELAIETEAAEEFTHEATA